MSEIFVDGHGMCEVWVLPKVAPKKQRKGKYVQESFVHPAKMDVVLCRRIIETYTEPGETVLDPMSGIGTTLLESAYLGRNAVGVELEDKFVNLTTQNIGLLEKAQTLTPKGKAVVIKGDSRELSKLLGGKADVAVFSPPYTGRSEHRPGYDYQKRDEERGHKPYKGYREGYLGSPENIGNLSYGKCVDAIVTSPPFAQAQRGGGIAQKGYDGPKHGPTDLVGRRSYMPENVGEDKGNISRMPYGKVDAVISSPPYSESMSKKRKGYTTHPELSKTRHMGLNSSDENIGNLPMGNIDSIITSPPYEGQVSTKGNPERRAERMREAGFDPKTIVGGKARCGEIDWRYSEDKQNLGNLKGETYLQAMFRVYRECFNTLKPGGKMVLVLKDFIRNKNVVRLDLDTKKLVEGCGFRWVETKLFRLPSKSFWRTLYEKKYPEVDTSLLKFEFVEVFEKPVEVYA